MSDTPYQISDVLYSYIPQDSVTVDEFSTYINSREEFRSLASFPTEATPDRGEYYMHQNFVARFMFAYDRLLLMHRTGTGKGCSVGAASESFKHSFLRSLNDYVENYLTTGAFGISRVVFLTQGDVLREEFKNQLYCVCSARSEYELNDDVIKAGGEKYRTSVLNKIVDRFYEMSGYKKFWSDKLEPYGITQGVIDEYSNVLFVLEEADYIIPLKAQDEPPLPGDEGVKEKQRIYSALKDLFQSVVNSKIMLLTATPMRNSPADIKPLMNLLLDRDNQMPDIEYNNPNSNELYEQLKDYFGGRVSFVRELDLRAKPSIIPLKSGRQEFPYGVYMSYMSNHQKKYYLQADNAESSFKVSARQASDFVSPTGKYGDEAVSEVFITARRMSKEVKAEMKRQGKRVPRVDEMRHNNIYGVGDDTVILRRIKRLSTKFYTVINKIMSIAGRRGLVFVYSDFRTSILQFAVAIEAMGYVRYIPSTATRLVRPLCTASELGRRRAVGDIRKRYAILTSAPYVSDREFRDTLSAIRSFDNRDGSRIRIVLVSKKGREGINIPNVIQGHILNSSFNEASTYQAMSRFLRSTSHDVLIAEEENKLMDENVEEMTEAVRSMEDVAASTEMEAAIEVLESFKTVIMAKNSYTQYTKLRKNLYMKLYRTINNLGIENTLGDPNKVTIKVDIYKHGASYTTKRGGVAKTIDYKLYEMSDKKDRQIKKMERVMRMSAIDCSIHKARNVRPGGVDGSKECDYQECHYDCIGRMPPGSEVNYEAFDAVYYRSKSKEIKQQIVGYMSKVMKADMTDILHEFSSYRPIVVYSAVSDIIMSRETVFDRFGRPGFLAESGGTIFIHNKFFDLSPEFLESEYTTTVSATATIDMELIILRMNMPTTRKYLEQFSSPSTDIEEAKLILSKIDMKIQGDLFEKAVSSFAKTQVASKILKIYENFLFPSIYEGDSDIYEVEAIYRGKKVTFKQLNNKVYLHTLYSVEREGKSYEMTVRAIDPRDLIRMYRVKDDKWVDIKPEDKAIFTAYASQIKQINEQRMKRVITSNKEGIYATILHDNKFRISDEGNEILRAIEEETKEIEKRQQDVMEVKRGRRRSGSTPTISEDKRKRRYGRECSTISKENLINIMYKLYTIRSGGENDIIGQYTSDVLLGSDIEHLVDYIPEDIDKSDSDAVRFYASWSMYSVDDICYVIEQDFLANGYVFEMRIY